ncbi:efflux RND transporter periplasmic adaptor subunit [Marilutibacter spongiae]|uniref:Efflux RND transporter periplasmic adaptor subunit n=1 Tax=Marilutibacter spongiae TaxID=2025720 RepID=A0A7W3TNQ6_9GAMM|nr:efflux RND transporter periplasmic adaptor subunit [Lysobacter spongiae]MBB1061688.1 efflux RND transporter periplasmic adaptor subunit [Lysobacter spongiae]
MQQLRSTEAYRPGPALRAAALASLLIAVAACGDRSPDAASARPVLVVQPSAQGAGDDAFAGDVRAREESPLAFRVGGNLVERRVDVGDRVERGQVLAILDGDDYAARARAARAQLAAAEAELSRARADQARVAKLGEDRLVSRSAIDAQNAAATAAQGQVTAARAELDVANNQAAYTRLQAPADGVIAARQAEAGQVVAAGQAIFTLAADGPREIAFAVPEGAIEQVKPGMPVEVSLWSAPGKRWPGTIREVSPAADPASRTYAARVAVDAATDAVELGQSARVYLDRSGGDALTVPLAALLEVDGAPTVYVVDPASSKLERRTVGVGRYGASRVAITQGLEPDEWVVAAGGHLLQDGQVVAPVDRDNRPVRPGATEADSAAATAVPAQER